MASRIRITSVDLQALVSSVNLETRVSVTELQLGATYTDIATTISYADTQSFVSYVAMQTRMHYEVPTVSNIFVDPDSPNKWFYNSFEFDDAPTFDVGKTLTDTATLSELAAKEIAPSYSDTATVADAFVLTITIFRDFTNSFSVGDAPVLHPSKALTEDPTLDEQAVLDTSKALTDAPALSEAHTTAFGKAADDSLSATESLSRTVSFVRGFTDSFTLDDAASVDAFVKDYGADKTNVFGFSDDHTYTFGKVLEDTATLSEAAALDFNTSRDDSFSVSESLAKATGLAPTDSTSLSESAVLAPSLAKDDSVSMSEDTAFSLDNAATDSLTPSEAAAFGISKVVTDSSTLSESLSRTVTYNRSFSDSFTLDDFTDVDAFVKETAANKTNVFSASDEHAMSLSKVLTDSASVSDTPAISFNRPLSDSFGFSEVVAINVVSGTASSTLNSSPLNGFVLNQ